LTRSRRVRHRRSSILLDGAAAASRAAPRQEPIDVQCAHGRRVAPVPIFTLDRDRLRRGGRGRVVRVPRGHPPDAGQLGRDAGVQPRYLIPVISLFLAWQKKNELAALEFRGSWAGVAVVLLGVVIGLLGQMSAVFTLQQIGFV